MGRVSFISSNNEQLIDDIINNLLCSIAYLEDSLTPRQKEIVNFYRINKDFTYIEIGKHFGGIKKQTVQKILAASDYKLLNKNEVLLNKILKIFKLSNQLI